MFSSFQRIKQLANASLSSNMGGYYTHSLHNAVEANNFAAVQSLIDNDGIVADTILENWVSGLFSDIFYGTSTEYLQITPLHIAAQKGFLEIAKFLVSRGADPDFASNHTHANKDYLMTPLYYACLYEHEDMADFL